MSNVTVQVKASEDIYTGDWLEIDKVNPFFVKRTTGATDYVIGVALESAKTGDTIQMIVNGYIKIKPEFKTLKEAVEYEVENYSRV